MDYVLEGDRMLALNVPAIVQSNSPMKANIILLVLLIASSYEVVAQFNPTEEEVAKSKLPLPVELREGAGVVFWAEDGSITTYIESSNGMSCTVDDPDDELIDIRCYNDQFWKVISQVRGLRREVGSSVQFAAQLSKRIESETIVFPDSPTAGYRIYDYYNGNLELGSPLPTTSRKWQSIHFPFKTAEEMGLPIEEESNEVGVDSILPFVMASGTWWSHVMIVHQPFNY